MAAIVVVTDIFHKRLKIFFPNLTERNPSIYKRIFDVKETMCYSMAGRKTIQNGLMKMARLITIMVAFTGGANGFQYTDVNARGQHLATQTQHDVYTQCHIPEL